MREHTLVEERDDTSSATAAELAMRQIEAGLDRIARERAKVRPEDWATLFRQMQTILRQLVTHPFVKGDMEAELLVERILRSENLDEVDARTDIFAEYAMRKLDYIGMLRAAQDGKPVDTQPCGPAKYLVRGDSLPRLPLDRGGTILDWVVTKRHQTAHAAAKCGFRTGVTVKCCALPTTLTP